MADFYKDLLNGSSGAAVIGRTPDTTGGAWVAQTGHGSGIQIDTTLDRAVCTIDGSVCLGDVAGSADCEVEANILNVNQTLADAIFIRTRATSGADTCYYFGPGGNGAVTLLTGGKVVAGTATGFGTWAYPTALVPGQTYNVKIQTIGTTIKFFWDNLLIFSTTDASVSAAGRPGAWFFNAPAGGSGLRLADLAARTIQTLAPNNTSLAYSPYNWKTSATNAKTVNPGAYLKFNTTGNRISMAVDCSTYSGFASPFPSIAVSVDNGPWTVTVLALNRGLIVIGSGLASATHTVEVQYFASTPFSDHWTTPTCLLNITAINVDAGATVTAPTAKAKNSIFYGDSIWEGEHSQLDGTNDARGSAVALFAAAFSSEYGNISFGGQGWTTSAADGTTPKFALAYDKYFSGNSRLTASVLSPAPDYVFVNHGTNDQAVADNLVQTEMATMLPALRTIAPAAWIFLIVPYGQYKLTALTNGVNTYVASSGDKKCKLIDLGVAVSLGLVGGGASQQSSDGGHPYSTEHSQVGSIGVKLIQTILDGTSTGSSRQSLPAVGINF